MLGMVVTSKRHVPVHLGIVSYMTKCIVELYRHARIKKTRQEKGLVYNSTIHGEQVYDLLVLILVT